MFCHSAPQTRAFHLPLELRNARHCAKNAEQVVASSAMLMVHEPSSSWYSCGASMWRSAQRGGNNGVFAP